ncbi:MAG: SpoIIE family protein phosphatase [Oscillospiraceae bacterium]|nr:SpoIIE family protein phosphatase [Oscillospiraceae bacterium]
MKFKTELARLHKLLASGELARERPQLAQSLGWGLQFLLGAVMAGAPLMDGCGPFGIAAAAQAGGGVAGMACSIGASAGYLLFYGFDTGIRYVAAVSLVFTAAFVFQGHKLGRSWWFMPSCAALFTLLTGILGLAAGTGAGLSNALLQALLAAGSCYFFREALTPGERDTETAEKRHMVALTVLAACLLMSLSGASLAGIASLGRVLAMAAVLAVAYKGGALSGCAVGCALGLAMDAAAFSPPFYAMAYGICGLIGGVFSRSGRLMFLISAILTGAACVICASYNGLRAELVIELLLASTLFFFLPAPLLGALGSAVRPLRLADGEAGLRHYTARRIRGMGEAFRDLYDTVDSATEARNDEDISKLFDRASELVCARCANKSECWNRNYVDTLAVFGDVSAVIRARGLLAAEDLPEHFRERCLKPEALVSAINGELRARMYRRQFRERLVENRGIAYGQYLDVAEVLGNVAEDLQNAYGPDYLARRRLGRYLSGIDLDADISVFRDRVGRLHIVLESTKLKKLLSEPGWLDRLSGVVGVRLCRPIEADAGAEGRVTLMEAEPLSVSVGIASLKKKGESVSGDRGTYFKTDQGTLCVILSDGMGSGEAAAKESAAAVRILERFLRAGVEPAAAMRMLNSMMLLKHDEVWGFATVDLMCVDLFTGETVFYKYGAAPSYVRSGRGVRRIKSETLAAGLMRGGAAAPDVVRLRLKPGSMALIASDGVVAETNDAWLRTLLGQYEGADTKALAREALQMALRQYGCGDDMTVLAMRVDNRA